MTAKGDPIKTSVAISNRQCFLAAKGQAGGPVLSFAANQPMTAGTDELGGNLFGATKSGGDDVLVPLGEGEWAPA